MTDTERSCGASVEAIIIPRSADIGGYEARRALPARERRMAAGEAWGERSPVSGLSPPFFADVGLAPGASVELPTGHEERAAYVLSGSAEVAGARFEAGRMSDFRPCDRLTVSAGEGRAARVLLLRGAPPDGPRQMLWNFVSSSRERIEEAKQDRKGGRFARIPGDDAEFTPLPEVVRVLADRG